MKKNYFVLFLLLGFSCAVSAQNNVFCENKDTASEECVAVAQKMYQVRMSRVAGRHAKTRKEEGKDPEKKQAMYLATHSQPADKFNEAFKACGEGSKTQDDAKRCLERKLRGAPKKAGKKAAHPTKNKNV
ncbi:MAG: hypothetical protein IKQ99_00210 [Alphaproteobacteria bacterium]|nr:hypothetical protein [Alphaproteobacteria bacterium]